MSNLTIDYSRLFQSLPERYTVFLPDNPTFTLVDASDPHLALTKRKREAIIGQPFFEVFPDVSEKYHTTGVCDLAESIHKVIRTKKLDTLKMFRYDIPAPDGNGTVHYWEPTHLPVLDKTGNILYIVQTSRDVANEAQAQQKLKYAQAQLNEAMAIGSVSTWQWDIVTDLVVADKNLARLFKY